MSRLCTVLGVLLPVFYLFGTEGLAVAAGNGERETAVEHAIKHLDPKYVCPMHPQMVRDAPGNCPLCGMELVALGTGQDPASTERRVLYYRHPHNPSVTSDRPTTDEMGMDYVPIYDDGGGAAVKISPTVIQNMGVRTALVERGEMARRIDTVGYVDYDETQLSHIHLRTDGWIERLSVKSEGGRVKKGEILFELYSPTLVNAQEEYLQALAAGTSTLVAASRDRLLALGVSRDQIDALRRDRRAQQYLKMYAPQDGVVARLNIREGMYVRPDMELMTLADLSWVWLLAEVFEGQAGWVAVGQRATVRLPYQPGRLWEGQAEYIYPSLDPKTRTLRVRLRFENPEEELKPNMFASVTLYAQGKSGALRVPREAVIRTGSGDRVIVDLGGGRFSPRKIVAGIESGDWVEIVEGLRDGERVLTSGQFLIDSEASLKASILRMSEPRVDDGGGSPGAVTGRGILNAISPQGDRVYLDHDAIPALGWSSMATDLVLADGVSLDGLAAGDMVVFDLKAGPDGMMVSAIRKERPARQAP